MEEHRLFEPWIVEVLVERPSAARAGWAPVWYQSRLRRVLFVKVTGRNIIENAAQKGATVT